MKNIFLILSALFCSLSLADTTTRSWVLNNGYIFPATFEKFEAGNLVLNLEGGKSQRVPVANLGVADRYYLHTEHQIPIEDLEGGNYLTAERDIKIEDSKFEKVSSIKLKGDGYEVELGALITPHFAFFHDRGSKVSEYGEGLEKVIFSHAYRMPGYTEMIPEKRRTFFFIKDFDLYKDLGKALVDTLRKEGKLSSRQINQLEVNWLQFAGRNSFTLPAEVAEKYNTNPVADIEFAQTKQADRENQTTGLINRYWGGYPHGARIRGGLPRSCTEKVPENTPRNRQSSASLVYKSAIAGSSTMRFWGQHRVGGGGMMEQTGFIGFGNYGDPKKWGAELASKVKAGTISPSFEDFYRVPSNCDKVISADELRNYWLPVAGLGRFFDQDLRHQIGMCRLYEFMHQNRRMPEKEQMPEIFGYDSLPDLEAAFKDFLINKNTKVKY